jgi:predicted alpha/beta-hydrolase family hydrolase
MVPGDRIKTLLRRVRVGDGAGVSSRWLVPARYRAGRAGALVLGHGAGSDMDSPFLRHIQRRVAACGYLVVTFNFLYKELGRRPPDPPARLEAVYRAVVERVRTDVGLAPARLYLGGKSMGGRIASHLVAQGIDANGLVLLGYPLHPANKPERLRSGHLASIKCPLLFVQGTRDPLCRLELLRQTLKGLDAPVGVHLIEGADHSFKLPKRSGRNATRVWNEVADTVVAWLQSTGRS